MAITRKYPLSTRFRLAFLLAAAGVLGACTSFSTTEANHLSEADIHSDKINGILYYLPIGRIHITGAPPGSNANTKSTTDTTSGAATPAKSDSASPTDASQGASQASYTITVSTDIEADPEHEYYLKPDRNYFYDDNTAITVASNGLLTTGNATATDQTVAIVGAIASLIPTGTVKASALSGTHYVSDVLALLATPDNPNKPGTVPPTYILESSKLKTNLLQQIDDALVGDGLEATKSTPVAGSFAKKFGANSTTTVTDVRSYFAGLPSDSDATKTYKLLFTYFAAHPTLKQLAAALSPPLFPDTYPVLPSLFAQVDTALTTKDMLAPSPGYEDTHDQKLAALSQQSSATIGDLLTFLKVFPQDQPAGNAYTLLSKQLLAPQVATKPFDFIFDPYDRDAVNQIAEKIRIASGGVVMTCTAGTSDHAQVPKTFRYRDTSPDVNAGKPVSGIAFRPGVAWVVTVKTDNLDRTQTLILPDKSSTLLIDYDRMPFVSKVTNIAFTNGMLTSISSTVPSPILGFLGIPKAILQAILPIPQSPAAASGTGTSTAKAAK